MLRLKNPISLQPSAYTDDSGKIVKPEPIVMQTIYASYEEIPHKKVYLMKITGIPNPVVLFEGEEYDSLWNTITLKIAHQKLDRLMNNDPQGFFQKFFPKSLENHPDGAGSILSNFLKKIGITSTPNCLCRQRAIEMNEKGPEWCLQNVETIVQWLKEEADKRQLLYQDWCIKALVNRAIKRSIKKCQNTTLAS